MPGGGGCIPMPTNELTAARKTPAEPDDRHSWNPPAPRWGRWLLSLGLTAVIGFGGGYWLWDRSARSQLDASLARLRSDGEPVTPGEITRPSVPAGDNAVYDLRAAAILIDEKSADWKAYQSVPFEDPLS